MTAALLLVYTNAPAGREAECARWYREVHIPDMTTIEGVERGTLHELVGAGAQQVGRDGALTTARFLAVYALAHADAEAVRAAMAAAMPAFRAAGRAFDGLTVVSSAIYRVTED